MLILSFVFYVLTSVQESSHSKPRHGGFRPDRDSGQTPEGDAAGIFQRILSQCNFYQRRDDLRSDQHEAVAGKEEWETRKE